MESINFRGKNYPPIALGTWSWDSEQNGNRPVFGHPYREIELKGTYTNAMACGFFMWDTTSTYNMGSAEEILGTFIRQTGTIPKISTKFTPFMHQSKGAMKKALQKSVERLGVSPIDFYWIDSAHDIDVWIEQIVPLVKEGWIRHVGVSNHNLEQTKRAEELLNKEGIALAGVQNHFSLLCRTSRDIGLIDYCRQKEMLFIGYMILEHGALCGQYDKDHPLPEKAFRGKPLSFDKLDKLYALLTYAGKVGKKFDMNVAGVMIAWARSQGVIPLVGVTKSGQIDDLKKSLDAKLTDEEVNELERLADEADIDVTATWEA